MSVKSVIKSQYRASLAMLRQAIEKCPESMWLDTSYKNPFWRVAYHTIIYTHFYLHPKEADFVPWKKHIDEFQGFNPLPEGQQPYTKAEVLEYLELCLDQVDEKVDALDLEGESGFYWLPFNKLELQFYNIRHIMQHTGELCERLGAHGEVEVGWVGMGK
jgi:hypothetical protein